MIYNNNNNKSIDSLTNVGSVACTSVPDEHAPNPNCVKRLPTDELRPG